MSDRDFEFGGRKFKLNKMDTFKQFHVVRRIAPILSELLPAMKDAVLTTKEVKSLSESEKLDSLAKFAGPVMMGLSKLSDADSEFVLYGLLQSIEMQQPAGNWARVSSGSMLMIQDLELPTLMNLAGRAFMFNLSGFFSVLPQ